jgi:hypothetical protein
MRASSSSLVLLASLALFGTATVLVNRKLPLVRNSLVYARACEHVIEHGYDPRPVVADSQLSYDKPILYSWLSAPVVAKLGSHDGLRLTSWLGTIAYLASVLVLARAFRSRLPQGRESALLWLSALGPCVFYQFWSAHPDTWFAALAILCWAITQQIVSEPGVHVVRRMVLLGAVIYVAVLLKNYGLILGISCPLYLLWHLRALRSAPGGLRRVLVSGVAVFGVLGVLVLLARFGHNPFSRLEGEGGGVGQYGTGSYWLSAKGTLLQLGLALLLQFQVALLFLFRRRAWGRAMIAPLVCFGLVDVTGLTAFPTTFYNMRYFVPLFPLLAIALVRGAGACSSRVRNTIAIVHGVIGVALIVIFNVEPAHRLAEPAIPRLEVTWIGPRLSLFDNLRMPLHREQAALLDHINREVAAGSILYMMDVVYYGDAQHGVYEKAGFLRPDIATRYVSRRGFAPEETTFYVWSFLGRPPDLTAFGEVEDLGRSLYRVQRPAPNGRGS